MPSTGLRLRSDFDAPALRQLSKRCSQNWGDGSPDPAQLGLRFIAEGPDGLTNRPGAGRPRLLSDDQIKELSEVVRTGPDPAVDGVGLVTL